MESLGKRRPDLAETAALVDIDPGIFPRPDRTPTLSPGSWASPGKAISSETGRPARPPRGAIHHLGARDGGDQAMTRRTEGPRP